MGEDDDEEACPDCGYVQCECEGHDEDDCPHCAYGEVSVEGGFYSVRCDCPCHWNGMRISGKVGA
jgi:hypothetical protein